MNTIICMPEELYLMIPDGQRDITSSGNARFSHDSTVNIRWHHYKDKQHQQPASNSMYRIWYNQWSPFHAFLGYTSHGYFTQPYRLTTSSRLSEGRNPWTLSFFRSLHLSARFSSSSTGCRSRFARAKVLQCCKFGITQPVQIILIGVCTILVDWMLLRFGCAVPTVSPAVHLQPILWIWPGSERLRVLSPPC